MQKPKIAAPGANPRSVFLAGGFQVKQSLGLLMLKLMRVACTWSPVRVCRTERISQQVAGCKESSAASTRTTLARSQDRTNPSFCHLGLTLFQLRLCSRFLCTEPAVSCLGSSWSKRASAIRTKQPMVLLNPAVLPIVQCANPNKAAKWTKADVSSVRLRKWMEYSCCVHVAQAPRFGCAYQAYFCKHACGCGEQSGFGVRMHLGE
jgi:hypothetical protein